MYRVSQKIVILVFAIVRYDFLHKSFYLGPVSMGKILKLNFLTKNFQ